VEQLVIRRLPVDDVQTRNVDAYPRISPFGTIDVYPDIDHGTIFVWETNQQWTKALPDDSKLHLEYSEAIQNIGILKLNTLKPDETNWIHVWSGDVTNVLYDNEKRFYGQRSTGVYRLRLVSAKKQQEWISPSIGIYGRLSFTQWRLLLKVVRAENRTAQTYTGTPGYLLKRKQIGVPCAQCLDYLTDDVKKPQCSVCYGTGFIGGYYTPPLPYTVVIENKNSHDTVEQNQRGPVNDQVISGRMLATAGPATYDVWADNITGDRYTIQGLTTAVHIKGVPVVYTAELRKIPFSYPVYAFQINK
jgi:hypothetical protein